MEPCAVLLLANLERMLPGVAAFQATIYNLQYPEVYT